MSSLTHGNPFKKNKGGGGRRRSVAVNGFRSKFEDKISKNIPSIYKDKVGYESESFEYIVKHTYTPDFIITLEGGHKVYIEAKGYLSKDDRRKMLEVKKQNPDIDIRFLFQKASNKIGGRSKTSYGEWCDKNGFKWVEGEEIPLEWFR